MAFEDEVAADSPELWWDTRQAVGASQPDASGNGNTGTITGSPTLDADGLTFTGSGQIQSVDIAQASYGAFALEVVVRPDSLTAVFHSIVGFYDQASASDFDIRQTDNGGDLVYRASATDDTDFLDVPPSGGAPVVSGLQHLLLDFDGTTLTLYLDGSVYGTDTSTPFTLDYVGDEFLLVAGDGYLGLIRHAIVYDHDLGPTRAAAHATAALTDDPPPEAPPEPGEPGDFPTLALSADLPTTTDLTPYGEEPAFNIQRGTQTPLTTGMVADAGTLETRLDNLSRDLDPENALSPFVGFLRPKVATTASATWGATTYDLLSGRVNDWPQSYPDSGTNQIVEFRATDLFQFLANTPINTSRPPERTGTRIQAVLDSIEYPGPTDIAPGLSMVYGQNLQTVAALSHLGDVAQVEYGELGIDAAGTLYFRDRTAIATDVRSTMIQAEYVQYPPEEYEVGGLNFVDVSRAALPLINHVTLTYGRNGRQVTVRDQASIDDYDLQAASLSLPFETYSQASTYGKWLLFRYSQPRSEFTSITFSPSNEPGDTFDLWADVLSRKEGDLIQITLDPLVAPYTLAEDPIVETCWIRGINYQLDQWPKRVQFAVQSTWIDGLFYWDTSDLDGPDFYGL